jgi:hypothetical protein
LEKQDIHYQTARAWAPPLLTTEEIERLTPD